jgi:hypothetical protein
MLKTVMFQVRVTPSDYERIQAAADQDFLSVSTWARRAVLQALVEAEARRRAREEGETAAGDAGTGPAKGKRRHRKAGE